MQRDLMYPTLFASWRLCVRLLLVVGPLLCASPIEADSPDRSAALRNACQYLWSQQADDGGWHSPQYAVMRSGQALTPFVLHSLLQVPEPVCPRPEGGVERALDFIRKHADEQGALGHSDPDIVEYPVYSTAYAVLCLKRIEDYYHLQRVENDQLLARMEAFVAKAQFDETDGFAPNDRAYGGWGLDAAQQPGQPGHMDLAHTRRALQAIRAPTGPFLQRTGPSFDRPAIYRRAGEFLKLMQKHPAAAERQPTIEGFSRSTSQLPFDGGFYFSPVVLAANKGREELKDAKYFRSYATATCDGILALLAAGVPRDDGRVVRAIDWLKAHDDINYPQGVPTDQPEPWGKAIRFYHYAVRAEAYAALDWPGDWRTQLAAAVIRHQAADGSFRNTVSPLMKEDDPILCTALATIALSHCARDPRVAGAER